MKKRGIFTRAERIGLLFASPWLIGFGVFGLFPIVASAFFSFCRYNIVRPPRFIGLENYQLLLFEDPLFWKSLWNTFYLTAFGLPLQLTLALIAAMLLNLRIKGQSIFRTMIFLPSVVPVVATAILWVWILNPEYGLINAVLAMFNINGPGWLTDPRWSKPALILVMMWTIGNAMIIFLASLQQVPQHLYEASIVDGANWWQRFLNVTIPMISPVIFFNIVMGIIGSFQYFTHVYIMTTGISPDLGGRAGGPEFSTLVYALYLYQNAFQFFRMGYA
ncbi:sugar ABC transporter permease, partial [Candidatus Sumerlaeota bacterium]|nr:sugar ABC transporter permease [Candidatus Sumerlaeota bacterium]